jgi:ElaB/YqjD/DUF883 family membrane-anchored ribosome-binding protein
MEDQNESVMNEMQETRTSLTEKLEALEARVTGVVENATSTANQLVENVKDTVHDVTEKVESGLESAAETFNLTRQTERRPWLLVSLATGFGCMLGYTLNRPGRRSSGSSYAGSSAAPQRSYETWQAGGGLPQQSSAPTASQAAPQKEGLFAEEMRRLKGLAVGALMGMARDLVQKSLPESVGNRLAQEFDTMTSKLGAEPIQGPVLEDTERSEKPTRRASAQGDGSRMRSGGSSTGLN